MKFLSRNRIISAIVAVVTIMLLVGAIVIIPRTAGAQQPALVTEQLDGWAYSARLGDSDIDITVRYDVSARGIQKFAAANRQLVNQLSGPVVATVVFQHPLSATEFQDVVRKSGVQVKSYTLRATDQTGMRITIQGVPDGNMLVPQKTVDGMLDHLNRQAAGVSLKGIISMDVAASPAQLGRLLGDSRIFTTDVTQAIAIERARGKLAATNGTVAQSPVHSHSAVPLYWFMENAGIAPK